MLPIIISLGALVRDELSKTGVVPVQKPLMSELDAYERIALINTLRRKHDAPEISEEDYMSDLKKWHQYMYDWDIVRPRWMKNVN